jgi:hypothetical protein
VCEIQCFGTDRDLLEFPSLVTLSNAYDFRYAGRELAMVAAWCKLLTLRELQSLFEFPFIWRNSSKFVKG